MGLIQELLGVFLRDDVYEHYVYLWCRCQIECERFDRSVCHHRTPDGLAIPTTPNERRLCDDNANRMRHRFGLVPLANLKLWNKCAKAQREVAGWSFDQWLRHVRRRNEEIA